MRKLSHKIGYLIIIAFIFVGHILYIPNGFTWLDHGDIEAGRAITPLTKPAQIFLRPFGETGFYRPLVTIFTSTEYAIYGNFAPGYHVTNVILHTAVVIVVPLFLSVFVTLSFFEIVLVMLVIGFHPLGWLPVGAISYRPELLLTLFLLLMVYFHAKAGITKRPLYAVLTIILLFCALLAKETAFVIGPLLILSWEILKNKKGARLWLQLFVPEIIILGLYVILRMKAVPQVWNVQQYPLAISEVIGTRISVLEKLLLTFINPLKPALSDAVPVMSLLSFQVILGVFSFVLLLVVLRKMKHTEFRKRITIAVLLFGLLLLPALNIVPVPRWGSPHYGYLPLAGFALILVLVLRELHRTNRTIQRAVTVGFALWMICILFTTITAGSQFKNDLTLFAPEVARDHNFLEGYFYLGNYYAFGKEYDNAESAYIKALHPASHVIAYREQASIILNLQLVHYLKTELK